MTTIQTFARAKRSVRLASPQALLPLSVPDADPTTGIFKIDKLTADIVVKVPKSDEMKITDSIVLYWDGVSYGDPVDLSGFDLGSPAVTEFDLFLKVADYPPTGTDTPAVLDYMVYDTAAEDGQLSHLPVTVRFDQLAPGGQQLPSLTFTEDQLSGITVSDLVDGTLHIVVDPYYGSAAQDKIELWLGSSAQAGGYLTTTFSVAMPDKILPVTITEAELKAFPPGPVYFGYRVTDWAGNVSEISELLPVPVFLDLPTLPAPLVPESDDGLITYNDAVDTVGVEIPAFDGAAVGDNIYVVWNGVTLPPYPIPVKDADPLATIAVPYDIVAQFPLVADLPVSYWLQRTGTLRIDSSPTTVNVNLTTPGGPNPDPDPETPAHDNIKAPDILCGTSPLNSISPADYGKAAAATLFRAGVDLNVIWLVDDSLQLYWGTPPIAVGPPIVVTDVTESSNIPVLVPFVEVIEGSTGDVPVYFTITRALDANGNTVTVNSPIQTVRVTSSGDLPGDGILAPGLFPEANNNNIITRAKGIDGTTFRIPLAGVSNIELSKNPKISYDFVGVSSVDAPDPTAPPIEASRLTATDVPVTQAMLDAGYYEVQLPYKLTYLICRNGATLDYSISNDSGPINAAQKFVRFAMNQGGGTCTLP